MREVPAHSSPRDDRRSPALAVVGAALAGGMLWGAACAVVAILRPSMLVNAGVALAVALGYSLIALWLCVVLRIGKIRGGSDGAGGEDGGRDRPEQPTPQPPSDDLDLWPEFERELRAYLEAHERTPVAG